MKRRVVLVDDHELFLAGVRGESLPEAVDVVGEARSVAEAIPLIKELDLDVVLLDVHLEDGGGDAIINAVAPERPGVRFLALSVSDAAEDVIGVIRAGARGYVTKTISAVDLAEAVERVARGDAVFSPRLAGFVLDAFQRGGARRRGRRARRADEARARGAAAHRARLHVQGNRRAPAHLRRRPSRATCRACCASSSSRRGTSSRAGRLSTASSNRPRRVLRRHRAERARSRRTPSAPGGRGSPRRDSRTRARRASPRRCRARPRRGSSTGRGDASAGPPTSPREVASEPSASLTVHASASTMSSACSATSCSTSCTEAFASTASEASPRKPDSLPQERRLALLGRRTCSWPSRRTRCELSRTRTGSRGRTRPRSAREVCFDAPPGLLAARSSCDERLVVHRGELQHAQPADASSPRPSSYAELNEALRRGRRAQCQQGRGVPGAPARLSPPSLRVLSEVARGHDERIVRRPPGVERRSTACSAISFAWSGCPELASAKRPVDAVRGEQHQYVAAPQRQAVVGR